MTPPPEPGPCHPPEIDSHYAGGAELGRLVEERVEHPWVGDSARSGLLEPLLEEEQV